MHEAIIAMYVYTENEADLTAWWAESAPGSTNKTA